MLTTDSVDAMTDRLFMLRSRVEQAKYTAESRAALAGQVHALSEALMDGLSDQQLHDSERPESAKTLWKKAFRQANDGRMAARVAALVNEWYPGHPVPWEFDMAVALHELKDSLAGVKDLLEGEPKP